MEESSQIKQEILNFLKTRTLGVISTIDSENNKPESAVVGFSETDALELIFGTFNDTRKYKNIQGNNKVAFVIGWADKTVQYEGIAKELNGKEAEECRNIHLAKNPGSKKFAFDEKQRFFKITPTWIRYSDFNYDPEKVSEIKLK